MADWNRFWIEMTPHCLRRGRLLDALMRSLIAGVAAADGRLRDYMADERQRRQYGPSAGQIARLAGDMLGRWTRGYGWTVEVADDDQARHPRLHRLREREPLAVGQEPVPVIRRADERTPCSFLVRVRLRAQTAGAALPDGLEGILRAAIDRHRPFGHTYRIEITSEQ